MPDPLVPSFEDPPRHESKGERIQRYASNLGLIEKLYKFKLEEAERLALARAFDVYIHLDIAEQRRVLDMVLQIISWVAKFRPPDD